MTKLPTDSRSVRGVKGPTYKVGPWCANPTCKRPADDAHHIWPRSFLRKQPQNWVELPDGTVIGNLCGLCVYCHKDVTGEIGGYKAAIRLDVGDGRRLWWCKVSGENGALAYEPVDLLDPQPPTRDSLVTSPADTGSDLCPTCGQKKRRGAPPPLPPGERRRRKNWIVKVPAEHEEDGDFVLSTLTEDLAPLLGLKPDRDGGFKSARYFVLVPALYFAQQNRDEFVSQFLAEDE